MTRAKAKRLVALSDMHVGSIYAVMPPTYIREDGNTVQANRVQKALYQTWSDLCDQWHRPDVAICNGDIIDGTQRANQGQETWTTNLLEQVDAATQLLKMLDAKTWIFTHGTSYHVSSPGAKHEETLARNFGTHAKQDAAIQWQGYKLHAAHHISYSKVFHYRTTPLARELLVAKLNEAKTRHYDWLIRSHVHYFVMVNYGNHGALTTPCWQTRTPYTIQKSPHETPDIGAVQFTATPGKDQLDLEIIEERPPKPEIVKL